MCIVNEKTKELIRFLKDAEEQLNHNNLVNDNEGRFSHEKWTLLGDGGILGLPTTQNYGGSGLDLYNTMKVMECLGYISEDGGMNFSVVTQLVATQIPLQIYGTERQKKTYLPKLASGQFIGAHGITEPNSGSDMYAMETSFCLQEKNYHINGHKIFTTNGPLADLLVIYAASSNESNQFSKISAFLVEKGTDGYQSGEVLDKMGLRTSPFSELFLDHCCVPENHLLGEKQGKGFSILETVSAWKIFCIAAVYIGEMEKLLEKCLHHSKSRKQFGQSLYDYQAISHKLADMKIGIETVRSVVYHAAELFQENKRCNIEVSVAKIVSSETYLQAATTAMQIFGGKGYLKETGVEHYLRNAAAAKTYSGTSEIHRNVIAALL